MKQITSHDPDLLILKSGGGWISLFGLPFLVFGAVPVTFSFLESGGDKTVLFFTVPFSLVFALIGLCFMLGRVGLVLDRRMKTITKWWGLLFPWWSKENKLEDFQRITISKEIRRSKNSTYTVYPVRILGENGKVEVQEERAYENARKIAETIAKFLFLPLADSSTGQEIVRDPDKLDESIRERVRRTGEIKEVPPTPEKMSMEYTIEGKELWFRFPSNGCATALFSLLFIAMIVAGTIVYFAGAKEVFEPGTPFPVQCFFALFFLVPLTIVGLTLLKYATKQIEIRVSPEKLVMTSIWKLGKSVQEIPTDEIEELYLFTGEKNAPQIPFFNEYHVIARSDKLSMTFGHGLSQKELEWLHAVIENTISV